MRVSVLLSGLLVGLMACTSGLENLPTKTSKSDLVFDSLAQTWDEGVPLGNATIGALVWKKGDALRLSLDRTDLWDLRPSDSLSGANFRFAWVKEHIRTKDYCRYRRNWIIRMIWNRHRQRFREQPWSFH